MVSNRGKNGLKMAVTKTVTEVDIPSTFLMSFHSKSNFWLILGGVGQ